MRRAATTASAAAPAARPRPPTRATSETIRPDLSVGLSAHSGANPLPASALLTEAGEIAGRNHLPSLHRPGKRMYTNTTFDRSGRRWMRFLLHARECAHGEP